MATVTAAALASAIVRIDAAAQGVNAILVSCSTVPAGIAGAWTAWYTGWQTWKTMNSGLSDSNPGLSDIGDQALGYEYDVAGWQEIAASVCGAHLPVFVTDTQASGQNSVKTNVASILTGLKWLAGAVILGLITPPIIEAVKSIPKRIRKPPQET